MSLPRTLMAVLVLGLLLGTWLLVSGSDSQAAGLVPAERLEASEQLATAEQPPVSAEPIQLVRSDADGIVLAVDIPGVELEHKTVHGKEYSVVSVPGFGTSSKAGSPGVPSRRILLGIPLGAAYDLRVSVGASQTVPAQYPLLPAPSPILEFGIDSLLQAGTPAPVTPGWEYIEDEQAYSTDAAYPQAIARVASEGFVRDQRYIAVQLNPVQVNSVTGEVTLHNRFRVEIDFAYEQGCEVGASFSDGSFEPVLSGILFNYESAAGWRGNQPLLTPFPEFLAATARDAAVPALKIMVDEDGLYQVTAAELSASGVDVASVPTTTYKLSLRGRDVPIRIIESGSGFEAFWFFGEQARTKYTDTNVYWLTHDPEPPPGAEPGLRMPIKSVPASAMNISAYHSATVRLEEDHLYRSYAPSAESPSGNPVDPWDHWFWGYTRIYWPEPENPYNEPVLTLTVQIDNLITAPYVATLRASLSGFIGASTHPGHCVDFYVNRAHNSEAVGRYEWSGEYSEELVSFAFSSDHLVEGANTVEVEVCPSDALVDNTFYDWFELDVRRTYEVMTDALSFDVAEPDWQYRLDGFSTDAVEIFDVTETYTVSYLIDADVTFSGSSYSAAFYDVEAEQGTRYLALTRDQFKSPLSIVEHVPSNLADPGNHADYIVIAPHEFVTDVQPLVGHRMAQGLDVRVVELEPIFDEFNYGIYSPEAIRGFLTYAFHNWSGGPPAYVLLVGDGTYDYKGHLGHVNPNRMPPYLAWVDPYIGETAADNRYVAVAGDDPFPDMHIGRLPAETTAQLVSMVDKIIGYETNLAPPDWTEQVLFVTDDPDLAGNFYVFSDDLVDNYLPEPYVPTKAYYGSTCLTGAECKQVILDTLNTTGALLVNYIGHAGVELWTANGVWGIDDLSGLEPTTRLPVMLPMTCWEGAFHQVKMGAFDGTALAEGVVRISGRGAVASWSATGLGVASGHDYLNKGFLESVLFEGVRELGVAADAGKARVSATGYYTDLIETYHLLGDPALRLNSLDVVDLSVGQSIKASDAPVPGEVVTFTLFFTNAGPDVAAGVVLTDILPPMFVTPTVVFSSPEVLSQQEGITFAWMLDDLQPGATGQIVLTATVDPQWPEPEASFINNAEIGVETHDLVPENNTALLGVNTKFVYLPLIMRGF